MRKKALRNPGTPFKLPAFIPAALLLTALLCLAACGPGDASTAAPETTAAQTNTAEAPSPAASSEAPASTPAASSAPSLLLWLKETGGVSTFRGEGKPDASLGSEGDSYIDLSVGTVWWHGATGWEMLGGLEASGYRIIRFETPYGEAPEPVIAKKGSLIAEPEAASVPGKVFQGWFVKNSVGRWYFDEDTVNQTMTLTAAYTDESTLPRRGTKLTNRDIGRTDMPNSGKIAAVVIFISMTDGWPCDREQFESFFTAPYDPADPMASHSAYYEKNSYGNVSFDYYFYYYDSGMSCQELYNYLDDHYYEFKEDVFRKAQQAYTGDLTDWDKNGDGYTDTVFFISGEDTSKTVSDGLPHYLFGNSSVTFSNDPDYARPALRDTLNCDYERMLDADTPAGDRALRNLLHETGHQFGLIDYYDIYPNTEEGEDTFDTLGAFDMQSHNVGDWNPYSRFSCGWLEPYVADSTADSVTLKLGCSSAVPDTVLIPTSAGWNGTAFDEYILVDVMAPCGANGYDWPMLNEERIGIPKDDPHTGGGVRILHVDSRLCMRIRGQTTVSKPVDSYEDILAVTRRSDFGGSVNLYYRFFNSNGIEPTVKGDSRYYHLTDLIPSDGSSRFRRYTNNYNFLAYDILQVTDLVTAGDVFSMETCADAFANAPYMNNGSTLDYEVRVDFYDPKAQEAIITISKVK
ncbi:MAG: hypothetical protein IJK77_01940 [Lachnospiraceae bacterium]|nr:hypothetical protein [Lachnospiraceae bacterium]